MIKKANVEMLTSILEDLENSTHGIEATSVVSKDGFILASALPQTAEKERAAVMSAAMHSLGKTAAKALARGKLSEIHVKGKDGSVLLISTGDNAVLTALTRKNAEPGLLFPNVKHTAKKVAELV
jgi:predicted regulator of Ras-like GTPase activity (Roadblock/LC7/MglB family)